jgi:hypothetical protein
MGYGSGHLHGVAGHFYAPGEYQALAYRNGAQIQPFQQGEKRRINYTGCKGKYAFASRIFLPSKGRIKKQRRLSAALHLFA